jgi:arylsulfatase A-like enzyme
MSERRSSQPIGRREFLKLGAAAGAAAALDPLGLARALGQTSQAGPTSKAEGPTSQADGEASRPAAGKDRKRPNILFVFSDEHRWCSLPFTEAPQVVAPNMARLAREGTRFDNCCSSSPICVPYRGMLVTGLWPHQSSCISNDYFGDGKIIGPDPPAIGHTFRKAGYATGYVGKWHLKNDTPKNAGFDYFQHWLFGDDHWETPVCDGNAGADFKPVKGYNAIGMTDQALDFIHKHAKGEQPFLMMLSINPPHWRWDDAPEEFLKLYPPEKLPWRPNVTEERYKKGNELLYYQHYNAHISAVDRELGRLMDALRKLGIEDDTILIYTSDHGSSFGSNGVTSKANPYEEAVRVPLVIRWPGHVEAERIADHNLGTIDLYPTLCGLAGIDPPKHCGGQDFSPAMLGKGGPDPASQLILVNNFQRNYFRSELDPGGPNIFYPFRGVRTKRHTFVVRAGGDWLLYDNLKDPFQLKNLVDDPASAELKASLRKELDAWLAKAEDPFIPDPWRKLSLGDRIAAENRHYSILPFQKEWDQYKAAALAPYLAGATAEKQKALRAAGERIFDEAFFGHYKAFHTELTTTPRQSKRPLEALRAELAEHEKKAAELLKAESEKIT